MIKHMPGHGRARSDSHHELPVVQASREELQRDFAPFAALRDLPMAMTAHVVYSALDRGPAGHDFAVVVRDVMRGEIGYDGLIMSDDVSMKALRGSYEKRAKAIFDAGLDLVLHCNGDLDEARAVRPQRLNSPAMRCAAPKRPGRAPASARLRSREAEAKFAASSRSSAAEQRRGLDLVAPAPSGSGANPKSMPTLSKRHRLPF